MSIVIKKNDMTLCRYKLCIVNALYIWNEIVVFIVVDYIRVFLNKKKMLDFEGFCSLEIDWMIVICYSNCFISNE